MSAKTKSERLRRLVSHGYFAPELPPCFISDRLARYCKSILAGIDALPPAYRHEADLHPGHARKMAAKLQAMGYEAHFYEPSTGGLSRANNANDHAARVALSYNFLRDAIRWKT